MPSETPRRAVVGHQRRHHQGKVGYWLLLATTCSGAKRGCREAFDLDPHLLHPALLLGKRGLVGQSSSTLVVTQVLFP